MDPEKELLIGLAFSAAIFLTGLIFLTVSL